MRFILMILAALGVTWWLKKREAVASTKPHEESPTGVQLLPDRETAKPAAVSEAPAAPASKPAAKPKPSVPSKPGKTQHDDLTVLTGIGKVFAQRLNEAGINTFSDLAQQSPDRLREITQLKDWQKADPQEWIDQAKRRADYGE